jgi:FkbM family methyltransferase
MDFEKKLENFYKNINLVGKVVIDIGAHSGRHAIPLSNLIGCSGVLFAFEPIPEIRKILYENIFINNSNNIVVYPFALSAESGFFEFNYIPNIPEESGLKKRHFYNATPSEFRKINVNVKKLDDLGFSDFDVGFIKIDVEGAELDVLRGSINLLKKSMPIVAFECGAGSFLGYHSQPEELWNIFNNLNYFIYSINGDLITTAKEFSRVSYEQKYWDFIALPPDGKYLSEFFDPST